MRLCRFGESRLGLVEGSKVTDVTAALDLLPSYRYPLPGYDLLIANLDAVIARIRAITASSPAVPLEGLKLLSPVANPGKIIAAPVNYAKHMSEVAGAQLRIAGDFAHVLGVVDRSRDDLPRIRYGAPQLQTFQRHSRRTRGDRPDARDYCVQICDEKIVAGKRISVRRQRIQRRGDVDDLRTFD